MKTLHQLNTINHASHCYSYRHLPNSWALITARANFHFSVKTCKKVKINKYVVHLKLLINEPSSIILHVTRKNKIGKTGSIACNPRYLYPLLERHA